MVKESSGRSAKLEYLRLPWMEIKTCKKAMSPQSLHGKIVRFLPINTLFPCMVMSFVDSSLTNQSVWILVTVKVINLVYF